MSKHYMGLLSVILILIGLVCLIIPDPEKTLEKTESPPVLKLDYAGKVDATHHQVDACIIGCMDYRFDDLLHEFAKAHNYKRADRVNVAGGAKDLSPYSLLSRDYLRGQICKSIDLHHTGRVVLVEHVDCGGFGGEKDANVYARDLQKMKRWIEEFLHEKGYSAQVTAYVAKFDGMYEVK